MPSAPPSGRCCISTTCSLERGGSLLLTTPAPPAALPIALADLASRLRALPVAGIAPPDDALLAAVLVKHFADRQLRVAPGGRRLSGAADRALLRRGAVARGAARPAGARAPAAGDDQARPRGARGGSANPCRPAI